MPLACSWFYHSPQAAPDVVAAAASSDAGDSEKEAFGDGEIVLEYKHQSPYQKQQQQKQGQQHQQHQHHHQDKQLK